MLSVRVFYGFNVFKFLRVILSSDVSTFPTFCLKDLSKSSTTDEQRKDSEGIVMFYN